MRKFKGLISLLLCLGICVTGVGCSSKEKQTSSEGTQETVQGGTSEPVTISVFCPNSASMPMNNDLTVVRELSERTDTQFDFKAAPSTGAGEKFNLMMASGDIPDLVIYVQDPILKYKKAFKPLNQLIEEYCPNYVKMMEKHPSLKKDITAEDGNIYTLNSIAGSQFANGIIIRQDWLDKLGLEMPNTLDDWYNVLKAFKEKDPNGNGEQDEVPLISPIGRYGDSESPGLGLFLGAWGMDEEFYLQDDQVVYGAIDPRIKDGLAWLNKLYSEGLLDTQYLTTDDARYQELVNTEKAGVVIDWGICVDEFDTRLQAVNPEADFVIAAPPEGIDGVRRTWSQMPPVRTNAVAISKQTSDEETKHIMELFDYIFSEEGHELMNYGVEGETFTRNGEERVYIDEIMNDEKGPLGGLRKHGINSWFIHEQSNGYEYSKEDFIKGIELYEDGIIQPILPPLKFTEDERREINSIYTDIKTYKDETLDGFITGRISLDEFDNYVNKMNELGIQKVIDMYNVALERYNSIEQ